MQVKPGTKQAKNDSARGIQPPGEPASQPARQIDGSTASRMTIIHLGWASGRAGEVREINKVEAGAGRQK